MQCTRILIVLGSTAIKLCIQSKLINFEKKLFMLTILQGLYWLGSEMPRSVPPELLAKTKELKTLTENHAIVLDAMMKVCVHVSILWVF